MLHQRAFFASACSLSTTGGPYSSRVRFTLPESPVPFHGVEEAKTPGAACPQQALSPIGPGINFTGTYTSMSDDCESPFGAFLQLTVNITLGLTLSVFAPQSATPHSKLPVFFVRQTVTIESFGWC
jgi:hypothetical protein